MDLHQTVDGGLRGSLEKCSPCTGPRVGNFPTPGWGTPVERVLYASGGIRADPGALSGRAFDPKRHAQANALNGQTHRPGDGRRPSAGSGGRPPRQTARVGVNTGAKELRSPELLFFLLLQGTSAEATSRLEPLTCSLRVRKRAFLSVAGVYKTRISNGFSLLRLAMCCMVLRSR